MADNGEAKLDASVVGERLRLRLSGPIRQMTAAPVWQQVEAAVLRESGRPVTLDLSQVQESDSSGAALVLHLREICHRDHRDLHVEGMGTSLAQLVHLVESSDLTEDGDQDWPPRCSSLIDCVGGATVSLVRDAGTIVAFIGELAMALFQAARHPKNVRWRDVGYYMERTGADALPIMSLISFLVGLILAYLGYTQLHKYGGDVFVADGVAYGMCRLFGPLMVAILAAGRSGSSFASEIGTMKVSEELDALDTMGLERARFIVVPKVVALTLMVPVLTVYADLVGMIGGFVTSVLAMDIAAPVYVQRSIEVLTIWTVASGLVKSVVFAGVIGAVACLRGFETKDGPQAVGEVTTSAVVSGFFLIVIVEGTFSVAYHHLGL